MEHKNRLLRYLRGRFSFKTVPASKWLLLWESCIIFIFIFTQSNQRWRMVNYSIIRDYRYLEMIKKSINPVFLQDMIEKMDSLSQDLLSTSLSNAHPVLIYNNSINDGNKTKHTTFPDVYYSSYLEDAWKELPKELDFINHHSIPDSIKEEVLSSKIVASFRKELVYCYN